jgi:LuxR family maltose regulon positive regulatory protein
VRRPRVESLLAQATSHPLCMVLAGAGYGKTRAVYSFLQNCDAVVSWIQLAGEDNHPARFWENYTQAMARHNPDTARQLAVAGFPHTPERFARYAVLMDDSNAPMHNYIYVFDDFHLIYNEEVLNFIDKIINTPLPNVTELIISRTEPPINTVSMLSKGHAAVLTEDALRFTEDEVDACLRQSAAGMANSLPPQSAALIRQETAGWALAVDSVCQALKKDVSLPEAISAMRFNSQALIDRELAPATPSFRRFLVSLSLLPHLPLEFLEKQVAEEHLRALEQYSAFIRFDGYLNSYRLHPLLIAYLREQADETSAEEKQAVYRLAAEWSKSRKAWLDAIGYYEKAGDYENLVRTVTNLPLILPISTAEFLLPLLDGLPPSAYQSTLRLFTIHIRCLVSLERYDEARAELADIIARYGARTADPEINRLLCHSYVNLSLIKLYTCTFTHDYSFPAACAQADEYYTKGGFIAQDALVNNFSLSTFITRSGQTEAGSLERYIEALDAAIPHLSRPLPGCGVGLNDLARAEAAYMRLDLNNCVKFALQAMFQAGDNKQYEIENRAVFFLLCAALAAGKYDAVQANLRRLQKQLANEDYTDRAMHYDIVIGWYYVMLGQTGQVADWLKLSPDSRSSATIMQMEFENLTRYMCYLADRRHEELLVCLQAYRNTGHEWFCLPARIELLVLESVTRFRLKQREEALDLLREAYAVAAPNSLDIFFVTKGADMRALTAAAVKDPHNSIPPAWLEKINRKASAFSKKIQFIAKEYKKEHQLGEQVRLDPRETELLRALAGGRSRLQIAAELKLPLTMVKSSINLLEEKIGAENQRDAVRIALEQKLI